MKAVKHPGICKICGQFKDLTDEHIPPKNAFNSTTVKVMSHEEVLKATCGIDGRMPWDLQGLKGSLQQGGHKMYCLCRSCNNNTGQWYMRTYTDFAKTINIMIHSESLSVGSSYSFVIKGLYPLRLYKAMLTMICDINNDCLGNQKIRDFLMNKEEKNMDFSKYSLYMYLVSNQMPRLSSLSALANIYHLEDAILVSEVASYPIGFALYINKPENYTPFGVCVDEFATFNYDDKCDIRFGGMPFVDINSQLPADYRSKDAIRECADSSIESDHI